MKNNIQVFVTDDHSLVQDGLQLILNDLNNITVIGTANNGMECLEIIRGGLLPNVILMDIDMPKLGGIETTRFLKEEFPAIKIIGLSMHNERAVIQKFVDAGADGYILKNSTKEELKKGIESVFSGNKYFSTDVTLTLLGQKEKLNTLGNSDDNLTERETEILVLIAEGFSNKEIGEKLFISHRTVDTHRTNLMRKLEVNNIAGLIKYALVNGLTS